MSLKVKCRPLPLRLMMVLMFLQRQKYNCLVEINNNGIHIQ